MERPNLINPYLQMSRLVGREIDFGMVEHFVGKYIDDAIRHRGQSYPDASNDLKQFFVQLSDAVFQAAVNYEEKSGPFHHQYTVDFESVETEKEDELLSVFEISKILKVTTQQVRNLLREGKMNSIKVSERGTRIKKSDFEEFMKSRNLK
jgi:excisionase family DNA binding protein